CECRAPCLDYSYDAPASCLSLQTKLAAFRDEPIGDRASIHEHSVPSRQQHVQGSLEISDAVRYTAQMWMQGQCQHARLLLAFDFALECLNGLLDPQTHFRRRMLFDRVDDAVIQVEPIGHGYHLPMFGMQPSGQVVDHPLADILDAGFAQEIGR